MPKLLTDCVKKMSKMKGIKSPYAICIATLRKAGYIRQKRKNEGGETWKLTAKGKKYSATKR